MATIEKRTGKRGTRYRVLIRKRGYVESSTFSRLSDARAWATETEAAIEGGSHGRTVEARKHSVSELIDRYIEQVVPGKKSARDQERILRWWQREIGHLRLAEVTPAVLVEKRDELKAGRTTRGPRSPGTVNRYLAYLSHPFTVAVREWRWMEQNPLRRVSKLKEPRGRVRFLSAPERRRLLKAAKASPERRLYPLLVLSLATGLRQGEALRLRRSHIDFRKGRAVVHDSKNEDRRSVPLTGFAAQVTRAFLKVQALSRDALIFADEPGGDRATFPRSAWEKAVEEAEVEDYRWHDNRHSAASALANSGATLMEIAEILGHRTLVMVQRYSHLCESTTRAAAERAGERLFGSR